VDWRETKYYDQVGFLYPYDLRYDPDDCAFCSPAADGRVAFRLQTEPGFAAATVVYNDGAVQGAPMQEVNRCSRFIYWETTIRPAGPHVTYSFALRTAEGAVVYLGRHGVDHSVEPLDRWVLRMPASGPRPPDWMRGAIMYQIFPERFANGDRANDPAGTVPWGSPPDWLQFQGGDLPGIVDHLDHLQDLGVEVLYLNPINTSPSTHKYDAVDFYHVDPVLGGDEALHHLVAELHRRGMRIIVDASFNHCHPRFFAFQDVLQHGPNSRYWHWFTVFEYPIRVRYRPWLVTGRYADYIARFTQETGIPLEALDGPREGPRAEPTYLAWYDVLTMPKLNQDNPATRAYFLDVAAHWLRHFDIDGWRMDVARHIAPDFWRDFRRVCRDAKSDCFLLAEIWGNTAAWLQGDQFDATMNYVFRDLVLDYLARGRMSTAYFADGLSRMVALYAPEVTAVNQNLLSSHDTERFLHLAGEDRSRLRLATVLLFTMPGAVSVYYGDEIGMTGGSDPDCRRAFPWHDRPSWDMETQVLVRDLAALRRQYPALRDGRWRLVWTGADALAYLRHADGERLLVLINRGGELDRVVLPVLPERPQLVFGTAAVGRAGSDLVLQAVPAASGVVVLL
jgi:glycosidase